MSPLLAIDNDVAGHTRPHLSTTPMCLCHRGLERTCSPIVKSEPRCVTIGSIALIHWRCSNLAEPGFPGRYLR
jgi:hypothetical protein